MLSSEFGRIFFAVGTLLVLTMVWFGYYRNIYTRKYATITMYIFVGYLIVFLLSRLLSGHVATHMGHQPYYALLAAIHGTLSLCAISLAAYMFVKAGEKAENDNYFRKHPTLTLILVLLWPCALVSGFVI